MIKLKDFNKFLDTCIPKTFQPMFDGFNGQDNSNAYKSISSDEFRLGLSRQYSEYTLARFRELNADPINHTMPWKELSPVTIAMRIAKKTYPRSDLPGNGLMRETDRLWWSFRLGTVGKAQGNFDSNYLSTPHKMIYGTDVPYANILQKGGVVVSSLGYRTLPKRPMLFIDEHLISMSIKFASKYILHNINTRAKLHATRK